MVSDLTPTQFSRFSRLIETASGIHLGPHKIELLRARLAKRMRKIGVESYRDYFRTVIEDSSGEELSQLLDHVTTNKTEFFREAQHFTHVVKVLVPAWESGPAKKGEPLRVWSSACSSGEEVWSLAMALYERLGNEGRFKIMGSDLSSRVLHRAKGGSYVEEKIQGVPLELRGRYWECSGKPGERVFRAGNLLQAACQFHRFNLLDGEDYPFANKLDAVFCRNVMIYFDRAQQESVVERIARVLRPGGFLYVGLSESLVSLKHRFRPVGSSVYQLPA